MNRLDDIAFEAAKRFLCRGDETVTIADTCPALLDLATMAKEMILGSRHYRSQFLAVSPNRSLPDRELERLSLGTS